MKIAGLPEGVEAVRFGVAGADEFEIVNDPTNREAPMIMKGQEGFPGASMNAVIVKPAEGWIFRGYFDPRRYMTIYAPARRLAQPETTIITLVATDTFEKQKIAEAAEVAKFIPGFVPPEKAVEAPQGDTPTGAMENGQQPG